MSNFYWSLNHGSKLNSFFILARVVFRADLLTVQRNARLLGRRISYTRPGGGLGIINRVRVTDSWRVLSCLHCSPLHCGGFVPSQRWAIDVFLSAMSCSVSDLSLDSRFSTSSRGSPRYRAKEDEPRNNIPRAAMIATVSSVLTMDHGLEFNIRQFFRMLDEANPNCPDS